ncbi:hypothetical protein BSAF29S_05317 [Bacillus safensis subsp. safensis]
MSIKTVSKNQQFLEQQSQRESNARSYPRRFPLAMQKAEGMIVTDADGREFYDLSGRRRNTCTWSQSSGCYRSY